MRIAGTMFPEIKIQMRMGRRTVIVVGVDLNRMDAN